MSRWSRAGARRTPGCRSSSSSPPTSPTSAPRAPRRGRRRRRVAHQHHQLDHGDRSRPHGAGRRDRRQGHAWRHVRSGGQADRAVDGVRNRPRPGRAGLPISAIGGITTWRDAAEFIALGAGTVQVCTAAMTYGFKVVQEMISGLDGLHGREGLCVNRGFPRPRRPLDHRLAISQSELCREGRDRSGPLHPMRPLPHRLRGHVAPGDIRQGQRQAAVRRQRGRMRRLQSVRAGLPGRRVHHARPQDSGVDPRTGLDYDAPAADWTTHPNNPSVAKAAE